MKLLVLPFFLFFLLTNSAAQPPVFQWAKQFGSSRLEDTDNDNGRSISVDQQGNVYSVGVFFNTVDFDPGPAVYDLTATHPSRMGVYISKLNTSGDFIWAKQLPLLIEGPLYITLDQFANVYVTGQLRSAADMDPGSGTYIATPIGSMDAFVIKLDAMGEFIWVRQFGLNAFDTPASGTTITTDLNNNVIICGQFSRTVDFDPGPGSFNMTANGVSEIFICKLNPNGGFIWAKNLGNVPSSFHQLYVQEVDCDNAGNIYTTGWFTGIADFDPGPSSFNLQCAGGADGFVSKLDANGNFVWAKKLGSSSLNLVVQPWGLDVDGFNNIFITGGFLGTQDFDPGAAEFNLISNWGFDAFILKLDATGNFAWAKNLGASEADYGFDIMADRDGNVYAMGLYTGNCDFDPGPGNFIINNLYDATGLIRFDRNGNFMSACAFNRIANNGAVQGRRMTMDQNQSIYITGYFGGQVDFDPGPAVYPLSEGRGWIDAFVVKLAKCSNITSSTITISTCDNYVLNNQVYDSTGLYLQTLLNSTGCDSIITLNLQVNRKFSEQQITICEGQSFFAGGTQQSLSGIYKDSLRTVLGCDSIVTTYLTVNPRPNPNLGMDKDLCENQQIQVSPGSYPSYLWQDGSNGNSFSITGPGLYWVSVTDANNCSATDSIQIPSVINSPKNFLKNTDSLCMYDKLSLQSLNLYSGYLWSTGATQMKIEISSPADYWLQVTDGNGCTGLDTIRVFPKQCLTGVFFPTAFTPNRDGRNDQFKVTVRGHLKYFKLQVYDRAGQMVFQTTDPNKGWGGKYKDLIYTTSSFVWQCSYQVEGQEPVHKKGVLTLIL